MRLVLTLVLMTLASVCFAKENPSELKSLLDRSAYALATMHSNIEGDYLLRRAQIITIKANAEQAKRSVPKDLEKSAEKLAKLATSYSEKFNSYKTLSNPQQQGWLTQTQITSRDPNWKAYKKLKGYAKSEPKALVKIHKEYVEEAQRFQRDLGDRKLASLIQNLPYNQWGARAIIAKVEAEAAYKRYNIELLDNLKSEVAELKGDIDSLAALANFPSYRPNRQGNYLRLPPGYTGPTAETTKAATSIISTALEPKFIPAAREYANSAQFSAEVMQGIDSLQTPRFSHFSKYLSPQTMGTVTKLFEQKRLELLHSLIAGDNERLANIINGPSSDVEKLKQLVSQRNSFAKQYRSLLNRPEMQSHTAQWSQYRLGLLAAFEPEFIKTINTAQSIAQLKVSFSELVAAEDANAAIVQRISQAQNQKFQQLMVFKPESDPNKLSLNNFTAQGLNYESELMALYLGDFAHSRLEPNGVAANSILSGYIKAFAKRCDAFLPANKVEMTYEKCVREEYTVNGYGARVGPSTCIEYRTVYTGLYADPVLYATSERASANMGYKLLGNMLSGADPFAAMGMADDAIALGADMDTLVYKNQCGNLGLKRFQENLYRFIVQSSPLLLPGRESMALLRNIYSPTLDADSINFRKLLDELIIENSKGWALNRYIPGSVSNIQIVGKNSDGSPARVVAEYRYNSVAAGGYAGSVTLTFNDNIPQCLYFSDNPSACRSASRRIMTGYEKGNYRK